MKIKMQTTSKKISGGNPGAGMMKTGRPGPTAKRTTPKMSGTRFTKGGKAC